MNLLSLFEGDFLELCLSIANGTLDNYEAIFSNKATVCKYAVPDGYPDSPIKGEQIDVSQIKHPENLYYASVDIKDGKLIESGSRTVAVVGIADTISRGRKNCPKRD